MANSVQKPLRHWWIALPVALLLPALFLGWPYIPSSVWWTRSWDEVRLAVFLFAGLTGVLTTLLLSKRGRPPSHPSLSPKLLAMVIGSYILYNNLRFPILVWADIATVDCARTLARGSEAVVWILGAPLAEETAYRVLPLSLALVSQKGWVVYAVLTITSILFASSHTHLPVSSRLDIGVTGMFLGIVFLQTSKWWAPVVAHALINAVVMATEWGWNSIGYPWCE